MLHDANSICKTVISGKEQNLNKRLNLEFPYFSNTLCTFWKIQYFFKVLKYDFTIQHFQFRVGTLRHTVTQQKESLPQSQSKSTG